MRKRRFVLLSENETGLLVLIFSRGEYVFSHLEHLESEIRVEIGKIERENSPDEIVLSRRKGEEMVLKRRWKNFWVLSENDDTQIFKESKNLLRG